MGWMDNLTRKVTQTEAVTGRQVNKDAVAGAFQGGLQSDYELAFKNAAAMRQTQQEQKRLDAYTDISNKQIASQYEIADRRLDLLKEQQDMTSMGNIAKAAVVYGPEIAKGAKNLYSWGKDAIDLSTAPNTPVAYGDAAAGMEGSYGGVAYTAGDTALSSVASVGTESAFGSTTGASLASGSIGTESALGTIGGDIVSGFGTTASEAAATYSAAGFSGAASATIASESIASSVIAASEFEAFGMGAMAAEGSIFAGAATALAPFAPFAALLFIPGVFDAVSDAASTVVDAVSDAVDSAVGWVDDSSVICTELNNQGYISNELYGIETFYGCSLPKEQLFGYRRWAKYVVKVMQKSKLATDIVYFFVKPVITEMASRVTGKTKGNLIGSLILKVGEPICGLLGKKEVSYELA